VHTRLAALAASIDEPAPAAFALAATALAANHAKGLESVAAAFADLGLRLHATEACAAAGAVHLLDGRPAPANTAIERAAELAHRCPGARTPLLNNTASRSTLTRREREIVNLAAAGRSSKQIAHQLGLSTRTVDNHLSHAYHKLGVRSRSELAR
jgi:DNA-binding CsgD family transcriptional regulator